MGCSSWGHRDLDTTKRLTTAMAVLLYKIDACMGDGSRPSTASKANGENSESSSTQPPACGNCVETGPGHQRLPLGRGACVLMAEDTPAW